MDDITWDDIEQANIHSSYKERKPTKCGICGLKTKKLIPHEVGKIKFYICNYCSKMIEQK